MSEQTMSNAVERQQQLLTELLPSSADLHIQRSAELGRYLALLGEPKQIVDEIIYEELNVLAAKFYLTPSYQEACDIIEAGGIVYGL